MGLGLEVFTTLCFLTVMIMATINIFVKVIRKTFVPEMAIHGSPAFQIFEIQFEEQVKRVAGVMRRAPLSVHQGSPCPVPRAAAESPRGGAGQGLRRLPLRRHPVQTRAGRVSQLPSAWLWVGGPAAL